MYEIPNCHICGEPVDTRLFDEFKMEADPVGPRFLNFLYFHILNDKGEKCWEIWRDDVYDKERGL